MLINANTQRAKAEAIKVAANERKYRETVKLADEIAERVREMVEQAIEDAANAGKRQARMIIGIYEMSSGPRGLVVDAHREITGCEPGFGWERVLAFGSETRRACYIHSLWDERIAELLADLEENGYEVEVTDSNPHRHRDNNLEVDAQHMVRNYTVICW